MIVSPTTAVPSATPSPPAAALEPPGTAVPAKFEPRSATFVSARTGWVLGQAPCKAGTCDAIVRTHDGGASWRAIPAPATTPDHLVGIRFADLRNGFVYGDFLWVTHDAGATWRQVPSLAQVGRLEASHGNVWFFAKGADLRTGSVSSDTFRPVATGSDGTSLVLHGTTVFTTAYAGHGRTNLLVGSAAGRFTVERTPCAVDDQPTVGARTTSDLLMVCAGGSGAGQEQKSAYLSNTGGKTWTKVGDPPPVPGTSLFLNLKSVFLFDNRAVEVSRDGGRSWQRSLDGDGIGEGGFESAELGYAIGDFGSGTAMDLTRDDGRTWSKVAF